MTHWVTFQQYDVTVILTGGADWEYDGGVAIGFTFKYLQKFQQQHNEVMTTSKIIGNQNPYFDFTFDDTGSYWSSRVVVMSIPEKRATTLLELLEV